MNLDRVTGVWFGMDDLRITVPRRRDPARAAA
ncbi:hypothetical protein J2S58_003257 [Nakamurella flavida]|nr:hypothetical protein [Nakamurella flavida]